MNQAQLETGPKRIPTSHRILAGLQLLIAGLALGLDLAGECGSCRLEGNLHAAIAALGVFGYGALLILGIRNVSMLFYAGVFAALGVHSALAIALIQMRLFCIPCLAGLAVAVWLVAAAFRSGLAPLGLFSFSFLPSLALGLGFAFPATGAAAKQAEEAARAREELNGPEIGVHAPLRLDVFESLHCPYCQQFREQVLPRLLEDFGPRLEVEFHDGGEAGWVRRTPTLVIRGGSMFEGLPYRYEDLKVALETSEGSLR